MSSGPTPRLSLSRVTYSQQSSPLLRTSDFRNEVSFWHKWNQPSMEHKANTNQGLADLPVSYGAPWKCYAQHLQINEPFCLQWFFFFFFFVTCAKYWCDQESFELYALREERWRNVLKSKSGSQLHFKRTSFLYKYYTKGITLFLPHPSAAPAQTFTVWQFVSDLHCSYSALPSLRVIPYTTSPLKQQLSNAARGREPLSGDVTDSPGR